MFQAVDITWIGHASFRLASGTNVVYIDPWKLLDSPHDADVVFVSHSHYDHCSPSDVKKIARDDTVILAPPDAIDQIGDGQAVVPGQAVPLREVMIEAVAAYNVGKPFHPKSNHWLGAVITLGKKRIYYAGDTDRIAEMSELADVDVALLPVGGTYTLNADDAAHACREIGCASAIPYHWGDIVGSVADAEAFARQAPCPVTILQPGQSVTVG